MTLPVPRPPAFVFLDFDGVIMDSMSLKLDSYCHAFAGMGFAREAIRKVQHETAGLSRLKTIPLMYLGLSGQPMPAAMSTRALARFTEHDEASRAKMLMKEGAQEFLEAAVARGIRMAIVTGTPQAVIERTVAHFDLGRYFARVCGTPPGKAEYLNNMVREFGLAAEACLYVGDAIKDQEAALAAGMPFAGVDTGDDPFRPEGLSLRVANLAGLLPFLG